ncbi:MAG: hypothetical protein CMR00_00630 [[Chlorobium] sp. 445]|nr:MAG: hypothetical protein CMR00_00630 [[Chlorobium] sp. 445]
MAEETIQKTTKSAASSKAASKQKGSNDLANLEVWYYQLVSFYERNQKVVIGAGVGVVLLVAGLLFWNQRSAMLELEANEKLAQILRAHKEGDWSAAIEADSTHMGLKMFVQRYAGTASGEIAKFYLGNALYERGAIDSALALYKSVSTKSPLLKAAAMAGEAACYEQKQQYKQAGERYRSAANSVQNQAYEAYYLSDAGRAFELAGEKKQALEIFEQVKKKFPLTLQGREAEKAIARLKI